MTEVTCHQCGVVFHAQRRSAKFCGDACRKAHSRNQTPEPKQNRKTSPAQARREPSRELRGADQPHIMNALQGHTEQGMAGRYGDGRFRLDILKEAVDRVEYVGLDLSALAVDGWPNVNEELLAWLGLAQDIAA